MLSCSWAGSPSYGLLLLSLLAKSPCCLGLIPATLVQAMRPYTVPNVSVPSLSYLLNDRLSSGVVMAEENNPFVLVTLLLL